MDLLDAIRQAKRVYICGNGGSAANAIHIANDLISVGIKAHALTADVATLTAIANDFGYVYVFSRQIEVLGENGDLLIALSGSGKSPNILSAACAAKHIGMAVVAITGEGNGGIVSGIAHHVIQHGHTMQAAEEHQLFLGHEVMLAIRAGR